MTNVEDIRDQGLAQILDLAVRVRRSAITNNLIKAHAGAVISGPFAGTKLLPEVSSGEDGNLPPKLLGCYEAELHPAIAKAAARNPEAVINIGCAEGYYAVGIARTLPSARVFAFEASPKGRDICQRTAVANKVADRVVVAGKCEIELLRPIMDNNERLLLIVDCEGGELELLDQARLPRLMHCDMIIECHDFFNPRIHGPPAHATEILKQRFSKSHTVEHVVEGPRDPNQFAELRRWSSLNRWLAVSEGRPVAMNWLVCWRH